MSTAGQIRARALQVASCTRCDAAPGQPCRNMTSNTPSDYLHRERLRAYLAIVAARHHQPPQGAPYAE